MAQSFEAWWATLGQVTKFLLVISIFESACAKFGWVSPAYFILDWEPLAYSLQLWRPLTSAVFLGKFGMTWMFKIAMFVMYLGHNEAHYLGKRAEFIWMLSVVTLFLTVAGLALEIAVISSGFVMALVWIYCRRNEDRQLAIYGFAFNAKLFPLVLVFLDVIFGGDIVGDILGVVAGHFFFFFHDMHPLTNGGTNYLQCPRFMYRLAGANQKVGPHGVHTTAQTRPGTAGGAADEAPTHTWQGRGNRLGSTN
jgi:Derlin-2/3